MEIVWRKSFRVYMGSKATQEHFFSSSKEEFCNFCHLLYERHLATGVGGNMAARYGNRFFLTPSNYSLRDVEPDIVAVVNEKGRLIE